MPIPPGEADRAREWFRAGVSSFAGDLRFDEPLSKHTYYRIGGPALVFAAPKTLDDLLWLAQGVQETGLRHFVLGSGSNLLVGDQGFPGLVIRSGRLNLEIQALGQPSLNGVQRIRTGASVAVSTLLRRASVEGWAGLELLTGIPGSVGGVVTMNAGTHLGEAKDRVRRVEAYAFPGSADAACRREFGELQVFEGERLRFDYRRNLFLPANGIVWAAEWDVQLEEPARVKASIDETLARRKATQPVDYPSCGSVFKNPHAHDLRAWQVIEHLGLRGRRIGGAQFSEKHPNFIINAGGASAADVRGLIELAKGKALAELGIELEEEVMYVGDPS